MVRAIGATASGGGAGLCMCAYDDDNVKPRQSVGGSTAPSYLQSRIVVPRLALRAPGAVLGV